MIPFNVLFYWTMFVTEGSQWEDQETEQFTDMGCPLECFLKNKHYLFKKNGLWKKNGSWESSGQWHFVRLSGEELYSTVHDRGMPITFNFTELRILNFTNWLFK